MVTFIRVVTLAALLTNFIMAIAIHPLVNLAVYFTNWAMLLSLGLTALVLKCSLDPRIREKKGVLGLTHIVFELATSINVIVVLIYWPTIHFSTIHLYEDQFSTWFHQHLVHIFPCLSIIVIFLTTDLKIKAGHSKTFPAVGLIFGAVNCYHVKQTGIPTYWFLSWEDY